MQKEDLSTKYTIIKLQRQDHLKKLTNYLNQKHDHNKSFCRFYLRGICIMKSQYCIFAHDFDQLIIKHQQIQDWNIITKSNFNEKELKQQRRKNFIQKTDFHQKPLFIIKQLDYNWLFRYQFSERYKKSNHPIVDMQEINKNQDVRTRIREIMHREQWDKMINFIENVYPKVDYTIDMFSFWFAYLGFEKAQTLSKFRDFTRYLTHVRGYYQLFIIVPPRIDRTLFFVKQNTYLSQNLESLRQDHQMYRQRQQKIKQQRLKKIPQNMCKRFICRFYMAGNCLKSSQQCLYVHSISKHIYDRDIYFQKQYRQPPKSYQDRRNYVSLFNFYNQNKLESDKQITLDQINSNFEIKDTIRKKVHLQLYNDFIHKLEVIYNTHIFKLSLVKLEYQRFGFNHTDQNKFGQLEGYFQVIGYHKEQIENLQTHEKQVYIYKIPVLEQMEEIYTHKISQILKEQIDTQTQNTQKQILESSIRRLIYSYTKKSQFQVPLHVYLKRKKITLSKLLEQSFPEYVKYIFFETNQQNFKKLLDLLRKYFKKHKNFIHEMDHIESHIKQMHKQQININSLNNWKNLLQLSLLELDKHIYSWPVANSTLVIDRAHQHQQNTLIKHNYECQPIQELILKQHFSLVKDRVIDEKIIIVDDLSSFKLCKLVLQSCFIYGVDLQGNLNQNGYIDLIQISCFNTKKYIFIIDIFKIKKHQFTQLLDESVTFLKHIFEDCSRLKIFHACQHDSLALSSILSIKVNNVFDTSGMQIYFNQRQIYRQMHANNVTYEHTLKKIKASRVMVGLNQILQKWKAPNGPNQYKQLMKKHFSESPRSYFEHRPLHKQFMNYSARDVEDLLQVYRSMTQPEDELIWFKIGQLYSKSRL